MQIRAGGGTNADGCLGIAFIDGVGSERSKSRNRRNTQIVNTVTVVNTSIKCSNFDVDGFRQSPWVNWTPKFPGAAVRLHSLGKEYHAQKTHSSLPPGVLVKQADPPRITPEVFARPDPVQVQLRPRRRRKRQSAMGLVARPSNENLKIIIPGPRTAEQAAMAMWTLFETALVPFVRKRPAENDEAEASSPPTPPKKRRGAGPGLAGGR